MQITVLCQGHCANNPIDFNNVIDKNSNEQSGDTYEYSGSYGEEIDPSEVHRAEPYFEFFRKDTIKKLFSRKWQSKEEGYAGLITEFGNNTRSAGTDSKLYTEKKQELIDLLCSAIERGLHDKIVQVRIKA